MTEPTGVSNILPFPQDRVPRGGRLSLCTEPGHEGPYGLSEHDFDRVMGMAVRWAAIRSTELGETLPTDDLTLCFAGRTVRVQSAEGHVFLQTTVDVLLEAIQ